MRADEIYVKKSIEKYLSEIYEDFEIVEGEDPPDYYVLCGDKRIQLEVTRAEPIYLGKKGAENRNTNEESLLRVHDQLNNELGSKIDPQKTLWLCIKGPINNYPQFRKSLKEKIASIARDVNLLNGWIDIDIEGNIIQITAFDSSEKERRIVDLLVLQIRKQ